MAFHLALQRALRFAEGQESGNGFSSRGSAGASVSGGVMGGGGSSTSSATETSSSSSSGSTSGGYNGFRPKGGYSHRRAPSRDFALSSSSAKTGVGMEKSMSMSALPLPTSKSMNGLSSIEASGGHDDYAVSIGLLYGGEVDAKKKGGGGAAAGDRYNGSKSSKDNGKDTRRAKWCAFCLIAWVVMWLIMGGGISQVKGVPFKLARNRKSRSAAPSKGTEVVSADFFSSSDLSADSTRLGNVTIGSGGTQRIILVTAAYNHIVDGVSMTLNRLVKWLLEQGHEVVVVAPTSPTPMIQHAGELLAVPSIAVPGRQEYRLSVSLPSDVRTKMTAFKPTLVHIATPDLVGHSAQNWARRHSIPVVCSYHTRYNSYLPYYYLGWLEPWYWFLFRRFNSKCAHMYVPSETVQAELEAHGVARDTIRMWSRGVDTTTFSPKFRSEAWRKSVGVMDDTPIIVLVSRIVWEKGLDVFVRVIRDLEKRGLDFKSVVVGEGPARAAMAKELPGTVFLGKQTGEALAEAYASSDIYFFPSHTETFGATSLEAMSSGLPVIVAGGPSDSMVKNGTSGFIVSPYSCETCFLQSAEELVRNTTLRRSMGEESRRIAVESFQWNAVFQNLMVHYDEVTNSTNAVI